MRVEGRTRVLSFGDVRLSDAHEQERADSVTRVNKDKKIPQKRTIHTRLDIYLCN